jgi:pyrimidine operon attenuation protein/uracil phosphoribosyltransferase
MNVVIHPVHFDASNQLLEFINKKLSKLETLYDKIVEAEVFLKLETQQSVKDKVVIVVDDVLNTGKTMLYSLIPLVNDKARKIQTLVLVDRNHISFPVKANYVGTALSTTLQEHIEVTISKGKVDVYLS